ncbi:hypothetical protein [Aliamphritea ceti]|nr:hypothetical protein [Aliamphritea ceti]
MSKFEKLKNAVDWELMFTLILTALVLGGIVWGMKKTGFKPVAEIAKNV